MSMKVRITKWSIEKSFLTVNCFCSYLKVHLCDAMLAMSTDQHSDRFHCPRSVSISNLTLILSPLKGRVELAIWTFTCVMCILGIRYNGTSRVTGTCGQEIEQMQFSLPVLTLDTRYWIITVIS